MPTGADQASHALGLPLCAPRYEARRATHVRFCGARDVDHVPQLSTVNPDADLQHGGLAGHSPAQVRPGAVVVERRCLGDQILDSVTTSVHALNRRVRGGGI